MTTEREVIVRAPRLGTTTKGGEPIYWSDLDAHWTRHSDLARKMPESVAAGLVAYLRWEGVPAEALAPEDARA